MGKKEKGVALILALLVLTILIVIIGEMSFTSTQNKVIAKNYLDDLQNTYTALSGYNYGVLYLQYDKETYSDHIGELWAQARTLQLEDAESRANIIIEDEQARINLAMLRDSAVEPYKIAKKQLERLIINTGYDKTYAELVADYIDSDTNGNFEAGAKNDVLYNVEELLRIKDFPYSLLYSVSSPEEESRTSFLPVLPDASKNGIRKFLTTISAKGQGGWKININMAPREVLMALDEDMAVGIAESIIAWRDRLAGQDQPKGFENTNELLNVSGMTSSIYEKIRNNVDVKSSIYTIKVRAVTGSIEKGWLYTVSRNGEKIELLQRARLNDFLFIQSPKSKQGE